MANKNIIWIVLIVVVAATIFLFNDTTTTTQAAVSPNNVIPLGKVASRTNIAGSYEYTKLTARIVVDRNFDGILECYKYSGSFYTQFSPSNQVFVVRDYYLHSIYQYGSKSIVVNFDKNWVFEPTTDCALSLSTEPGQSYREVFVDIQPIGGGGGGSGSGTGSGSSGFICDTDYDNQISKTELIRTINKWVIG